MPSPPGCDGGSVHVTASTEPPLAKQLEQLDVPVVLKPFQVADLEQTLNSALRRSRAD
jgi:hypothetical protein